LALALLLLHSHGFALLLCDSVFPSFQFFPGSCGVHHSQLYSWWSKQMAKNNIRVIRWDNSLVLELAEASGKSPNSIRDNVIHLAEIVQIKLPKIKH